MDNLNIRTDHLPSIIKVVFYWFIFMKCDLTRFIFMKFKFIEFFFRKFEFNDRPLFVLQMFP